MHIKTNRKKKKTRSSRRATECAFHKSRSFCFAKETSFAENKIIHSNVVNVNALSAKEELYRRNCRLICVNLSIMSDMPLVHR